MSPRTFLVLSLGLLAGVLSQLICWLLPTAGWLNNLPWYKPHFPPVAEAAMRLLHLVLGVAGAWTAFALRRGLRLWGLIGVALVLCFTTGLALAQQELTFDSFRAAFALLCGVFIGWLLGMGSLGVVSDLKLAFGNTVGPVILAKLGKAKVQPNQLAADHQPASVLTYRVLNSEAFQSGMSAAEFFARSEKMLAHLHGFLLRRGCYVPVGGSFETIQAVVGLPVASKNGPLEALATATLLRTSLMDLFAEKTPTLEFSIAIASGQLSSGISDNGFQVFGSLLETSRDLAKPPATASKCPILLDAATNEAVKFSAETKEVGENGVFEWQEAVTDEPKHQAAQEIQNEPEAAKPVLPKKKKKGKLPPDRRKIEVPVENATPVAKALKADSVTISLRSKADEPNE